MGPLDRVFGRVRGGDAAPSTLQQWRQLHPTTYVTHWLTALQTLGPMGELPCPVVVAGGSTRDDRYYSEGRLRPDDPWGIFHLTLEGSGIFADARGEHRTSPGSGYLFQACDPEVSYWYPAGSREPWRWLWISFGGGIAIRWLQELRQSFGGHYPLGMAHPCVQRLCSFSGRGFSTLPMHAVDGLQMVTELLVTLAGAHRAATPPDHARVLLEQAMQLMGSGLKALPVGKIAGQLGISREYLTRLFLRHTGLGPRAFLLRQRVHRASHLLKETDLSVKEVAARSGFASAVGFARAFRRITGMTPARFRIAGTLSRF